MAAANLGVVPTVVIIAVILTVVIWLVRFISGIKKTNDFYKSRISDPKTDTVDKSGPDQNTGKESLKD